jgi:hypothetical protein
MKLSHEKLVHLSHVVLKALESFDDARLIADRNHVRLQVLDMLREQLRKDEQIELRVRTKIQTQKRSIPEGSQEWDILFRKYYEEELDKFVKA